MDADSSLQALAPAELLGELGERLAAHRVDLRLTQAALATQAGVSKRTVERLESGGSVQLSNFLAVLRALGLLDGIAAALPVLGPNPNDLAKLRRQRSRVRTPTESTHKDGEWKWGDER